MTNNLACDALIGLAERVEALTGPDREVDCLIWATVIHGGYEWTDANILRVPSCGLRIGSFDPALTGRNFTCWHEPIPAYTASLDASLPLAPEGWFKLERQTNDWMALGLTGRWCRGATPALALCAAALRARATSPAQGD
jgi:hypothetical protein